MATKKEGLCKLTGDFGPFRNSHIIPKAFMRRASNEPFREWDGVGHPKRMYDGWYDQQILGQRGEDILGKYDDAAAKCFIDTGCTYRKRRNPLDLTELQDNFVPATVFGISGVDTKLIRLFGLSLLWRAAVSDMPAFDMVKMRERRLEEIRRRLLLEDPGSPCEFPVYFAVLCGHEEVPKIAPYMIDRHPFYRFFLDGAVCYVSPFRRPKDARKFEDMYVGIFPDKVGVVCIPSDFTHHSRMAREQTFELFDKHGDVFKGGGVLK